MNKRKGIPMQRKIRKYQKKRLLKLMCLSAAMLATTIAPQALADTIGIDETKGADVTSPCYVKSTDNHEHTASLDGNVTIITTPGSYALCAEATGCASGDGAQTLNVNSGRSKTVKIVGDIVARSNKLWCDTGTPEGMSYYGSGKVSLTLNNAQSYLAGSMKLAGDYPANADIVLNLKNGATWYVPDDSYTLADASANGIHINLDGGIDGIGGIVDLYHTTPTSIRTTPVVGERTFSLETTGTSANKATFVLSSDIAHDKADSVTLNGVTGTNTYYVQVAHDASDGTDGTYTASGQGVTVLTANGGTNTVTAKSYTRTKDVTAGLMTKTLTITPTLTTTNGITNLTSVTVATTESTAGPAQTMATAATSTSKGAMSSWRAENNDLLRRMGDLREDEGKAGTWGRIYGGETQINTAQTSTLTYRGVQIGYDRKIDLRGGKLFTGYALSHMNGDVSYSSGSGDTESTMFGIYGSYLGEKGHFADLIVKYGRLKNSFSTTANSVLYQGDNSANGLNMSLEYGYHQELKDNWYLEPQVELNYGHINSSDYTMKMNGAAGATVSNGAMDSLIGRIGVNIGRKTPTGNIYAKLSLAREFAGDVALTTKYGTYSNNSSDSMKDTWLEYGIGFNSKINKTSNLYGEISRTTGNKAVDKWKANIGYRHSF